MDSEIKEMIKDIKEMLGTIDNTDISTKAKVVKEALTKAINQPCKISITKSENGKAELDIEGYRLALLVTLAGAEKNILKQLNCTDMEFDSIKHVIGSSEIDEEVI